MHISFAYSYLYVVSLPDSPLGEGTVGYKLKVAIIIMLAENQLPIANSRNFTEHLLARYSKVRM